MPPGPIDNIIHPTLTLALSNTINWFFQFTVYIAIIVLIYLGILYITNKEEGIKKTHSWLGYLAIGILIVFLSRILIQAVYLLLVG
ncbi:MAG: hypothetical protein KatS3mg097_381 [Candidatus Parcubacteria bacterium]|nr:MAG: hypothetical protein KatS3mg097_381 [Candidatus Parcubacteria bacterium]